MKLLFPTMFSIGLLLLSPELGTADDRRIEFFENKIRPVLAEHCYECHSSAARQADRLKADLLLDSGSAILEAAIVTPGNPEESALVQALHYQDQKMPPAGKLPAETIADFEEWIRTGAALPADGPARVTAGAVDWAEARSSWAYQVPQEHALPAVTDRSWATTAIDHFVLAALEGRGLRPVRRASAREWLRRASLDLVGLPPSAEECDALERNPSPTAYARAVDRLLASPHYGERWARYWLDLARYADDQGNAFLSPSPTAHLYRDWVVGALNRDMPYDQFLRLQIAGDQMTEPTTDYVDRLAGLGFQGLGPRFRKGAADEAKAKADELEDRVDTLARGLLGLTVSCARCHDHKFDPIPTQDYYSLASAYHNATWEDFPLASPSEAESHRQWQAKRDQLQAELKAWSDEQAQRRALVEMEKIDAYCRCAWRVLVSRRYNRPLDEVAVAEEAGLPPYFLRRWMDHLQAPAEAPLLASFADAVAQSPDKDLEEIPADLHAQIQSLKVKVVAAAEAWKSRRSSQGEKGQETKTSEEENAILGVFWKNDKSPFFVIESELPGLLDASTRLEQTSRLDALEKFKQSEPPLGPLMPSVRGGGEAMQVFLRGNPANLGPIAPPRFLQILSSSEPTSSDAHFTRLDLANAIASRQNPLTARVIVNRVWHYHFGRGIVATLSNFGRLGSPPTHPELLDSLAVRFMESGWSLKWLHREIMLSSTYRLSSMPDEQNMGIDPGNEYCWRMTPRRIDIEAWRDAVLSVAGELDDQVGGPTLDQANPGLKEIADFEFFSRLNGQEADHPQGRRRTLYSIVSRYAPNATLTMFDFPEPNVASEQRHATTIPQQQLFVLNSEFMMEMSRHFAARIRRVAGAESERIEVAWRLALGRSPTGDERKAAATFLCELPPTVASEGLDGWQQLAHALLCSNEFMFFP